MNNNLSDIPNAPVNNCKYTTIDIALYLLDKMTPEEGSQFECHLTTCESCRTALKKIDNVARLVEEEEKKTSIPPRKHVHYSTTLLLSSAAVIVLLLVSAYFLSNSSDITTERAVRQQLTPEEYLHSDSVRTECDTIRKQ